MWNQQASTVQIAYSRSGSSFHSYNDTMVIGQPLVLFAEWKLNQKKKKKNSTVKMLTVEDSKNAIKTRLTL